MAACQLCGRGPARRLTIRRHVGMIVLQKFIRITPTLCKDCGRRTIWQYTGRTLVQGWWGLISLVIANPFAILMNMVALLKARSLGDPEGEARFAVVKPDVWRGAAPTPVGMREQTGLSGYHVAPGAVASRGRRR
jgi:hypothetical protein